MKRPVARRRPFTAVKMEKRDPIHQAIAILAKLRNRAHVSDREMRRAARIVKTVLAQESDRLLKAQGRL